jgi:hypothetical protein
MRPATVLAWTAGLSAALLALASARAQSFNIAFAPGGQAPAPAYPAAGRPGQWLALTAAHNTNTYNLVDVDGVITGVRLWQYGGTALLSNDDPATSGDDQLLMDDCLVTYSPTLETCTFFYNLIEGEYEILVYAMMPGQPAVQSYTSCDEEPGYPHLVCGGPWPGGHRLGITYSRHIARAGEGFPGLLRIHSGVVPGQPPEAGAAMNGLQLRLLPDPSPGDTNCDAAVDAADIPSFVLALLDPAAYWEETVACNIRNADLNGDQQADPSDIAPFIDRLLAP